MQSEICGKSNALPLGKQAAVTLAINHLNRIWECVPCRYNFPACWQSKGLHTSVSYLKCAQTAFECSLKVPSYEALKDWPDIRIFV